MFKDLVNIFSVYRFDFVKHSEDCSKLLVTPEAARPTFKIWVWKYLTLMNKMDGTRHVGAVCRLSPDPLVPTAPGPDFNNPNGVSWEGILGWNWPAVHGYV